MERDKELYRLWFEYLKRNDDYKVFCEWTKENSDRLRNDWSNTISPSIYKESSFWEVLRLLGYVHDFFDFEDWWTENRGFLEQRKRVSEARENMFPPCKVVSEKTLFEYLKTSHTVEEAKEYPNPHLFIQIDLCHGVEEIKKAVAAMVRSEIVKKRMKACREAYSSKDNPELARVRALKGDPISKNIPKRIPDAENLDRYLKVYDLWVEKMKVRNAGDPSKWQEIMDVIEPGRDVKNDEDRRLFNSYKERAEKIIKNAAQGVFPGKYL